MRILIVEDEFISRKIINELLQSYGHCDTVVNGKEAIEAFKLSLESNKLYDLVCLDIMIPEIDGQGVLKEIRNLEKGKGILGLNATKVIMTTALNDFKTISKSFQLQCEAYLVKPIDEDKLVSNLKKLGLL